MVLKVAEANGLLINCIVFLYKTVRIFWVHHRRWCSHTWELQGKSSEWIPDATERYFRKFVKDYAVIARRLTELLRGTQEFIIGYQEQAAVQALKIILTSEPV